VTAVSLADFGATGDPSYDATPALMSALSQSRKVLVPAGVHSITSAVVSARSFVLEGEGRDASFLNVKNDIGIGLTFEDSVGAAVRDLTIQYATPPSAGALCMFRRVRGFVLDNVRLFNYRSAIILGAVADGVYGRCLNVSLRGVKCDAGPIDPIGGYSPSGTVMSVINANGISLDRTTELNGRAKSVGLYFAGFGCDTVDVQALIKDCGTALRAGACNVSNVNLSGARFDGVQSVGLQLETLPGVLLSSWHAAGGLWIATAGYGLLVSTLGGGRIGELALNLVKLDGQRTSPIYLASGVEPDGRPTLTGVELRGRMNATIVAPGEPSIKVDGSPDMDVSGFKIIR
jgi:hypothetical protein